LTTHLLIGGFAVMMALGTLLLKLPASTQNGISWFAAFFAYRLVLAPAVTRFVASIFAILTVSDYLHQVYTAIMNQAQ
jgi:hypothetical protein